MKACVVICKPSKEILVSLLTSVHFKGEELPRDTARASIHVKTGKQLHMQNLIHLWMSLRVLAKELKQCKRYEVVIFIKLFRQGSDWDQFYVSVACYYGASLQ